MMFKTVLANVAQKFLHARDLDHARSAERIQGVIGERAFADIAAHNAAAVVGGEAREAHRPRFYTPYARAERVFFTDCSGNDFLEVHAHILKEMLGEIAAVEADCLVGVVAVVIVPVEQRTGGFRGQPQGVHAKGAANVHLASAGD